MSFHYLNFSYLISLLMSPTLLSKFQLGFIIISYFITYFNEHFLRVSFNQIDTYFLFVHPYYQNSILELPKTKSTYKLCNPRSFFTPEGRGSVAKRCFA